MNKHIRNWFRRAAEAVLVAAMVSSCAQGATNFNDVGKATSLLLQSLHFSRKEFNDELSQNFLNTYLKQLDPSKIFFTQQDVDSLKAKFGTRLDNYLLKGETMEAAVPLYTLYCNRVKQRVEFAQKLLKSENFTFTRDKYIPLSRKKIAWPKDEAEMEVVWRDMIEEQLLSEVLRRDTISRLAKDQGKPDPSANEKSPKEKLLLRYDRILRNLNEACEEEDVANALLSAVALTYDPHTDYMSARETDRFKSEMGSYLIGIGALLGAEDDGSVKINGIVVGGPAEKSGELKLNDRIVGVDSNNTGEMTDILFMRLDKVVDMVRGKEGTTVRLKIDPANAPGQTKIVTLTRTRVDLKEELAKGEIIEVNNGNKIGILSLPSFYADMDSGSRRCSTDVKKILERMVQENVSGLIINLRNNGGGSLEEVRRMTGFFVGSGPIVQIKNSYNQQTSQDARNKQPIFEGPLVVLTNKLSASASEILAAALQDYGRAVIVGDQSTFGKGTVQQPVDIGKFLPFFSDRSRAGLVKITTQKFYRIAGGSTQLKGVESDIVLPDIYSVYDIGEAFEDFAMPYDKISKSPNYTKDTWIDKHLPFLRARSKERIHQDRDFQIVQEDIAYQKKRILENRLSINKQVREAENQKLFERRQAINAERRIRFAEMAKSDAKKYKIFRLTLEDVNKRQLPQADPEKDNEQYMKMVESPTQELDDSPEYPSGLDPELRECINIVSDMVDLKQGTLAENSSHL